MTRSSIRCRRGLSLLELIAVVSIFGVIAIVVVPRLGSGASHAKSKSCSVNREIIEIQCALWRRNNGSWPSTNLTTIGADKSYFPEGLPNCPVDGSSYEIDSSTGRLIGHAH